MKYDSMKDKTIYAYTIRINFAFELQQVSNKSMQFVLKTKVKYGKVIVPYLDFIKVCRHTLLSAVSIDVI